MFLLLQVKTHNISELEARCDSSELQNISERNLSGSQALLEIAVRSGLSLLFALLQQSWSYSEVTGRLQY